MERNSPLSSLIWVYPPWLTFQQLSVCELNPITVSMLSKIVQKSGAEQENEHRFPSSQTKVSATRWSLQPLLPGRKGKQHWFIWAPLKQSHHRETKQTSAHPFLSPGYLGNKLLGQRGVFLFAFGLFFCLLLSLYFHSAWNQWVLILSRAL